MNAAAACNWDTFLLWPLNITKWSAQDSFSIQSLNLPVSLTVKDVQINKKHVALHIKDIDADIQYPAKV